VPRFTALAPLACASIIALSPAAKAQEPIPASATVEEQVHAIELEVGRDGATLQVTRSLFNPTLSHARVDLPITLPCEATVDELRIEERGPEGFARWKAAELLDPDEADARFDAYYSGSGSGSGEKVVGDSDTAVLMTRDDWRCDVDLAIWPVPPVQQRTVAYRVFIPSVYEQGRYTIELPSLAGYGLTPELELTGLSNDAEVLAAIGNTELSVGTTLDGAHSHTIVLSPRDPGRGRVRAVDLDVDTLVTNTPAAAARLAPDSGILPRMLEAELEAPAELAKLPGVRRAVLLIDTSRSVSDYQREQLQQFGAAYFEALAAMDTRVEVVLFDREVRRVYHDFVPAAWGAEDLVKLDIQARNGSEVGGAVAYARALLSEPSEVGGADWIIVLSDLYLRSDFDVGAQLEAAEHANTRLHVVRAIYGKIPFAPAAGDDPWTAVARAGGGMAWESADGSLFADELVSPKRIWNLDLELELADGSHHSEALESWLAAGQRREWSDYDHAGPALVRAAFVGEVWGQRRAWTASPDPIEGMRTAAAFATNDPSSQLSDAVRTALAFHAGVVSPFSSAWALAQFDGAAPSPTHGLGYGNCGGGSYGSSTRCGGVISCSHPGMSTAIGFDVLAQEALDRCGLVGDGGFSFETTDLEIVAVAGSNRCVKQQTWATDIEPTESAGRKRVTVAYAGGRVTGVDVASL
jgi:hypothetical protein